MNSIEGSYYEKRMAQKMEKERLENIAKGNILANREEKNATQKINMIEVNKLDDFEKHIFSKLPENKFEELKDSIKRNGVLSPIIVRAKQDRYEILSGHNRTNCCKELGINEIPSIIKDYDNIQAELIMIETNLAQRENMLPVEKGLAYYRQLEILKNIRANSKFKNDSLDSSTNDLEETATEWQEYSIDTLSNNSGDGKSQIKVYIRLTCLIQSLKDKVNSKELSIKAGYELSYINNEEQVIINDTIEELGIQLSVVQAEKIRSIKGTITRELVIDAIKGKTNKVKNVKFTGKIEKPIYKKYIDKFNTDKEFNELIDILLEKHFNSI